MNLLKKKTSFKTNYFVYRDYVIVIVNQESVK